MGSDQKVPKAWMLNKLPIKTPPATLATIIMRRGMSSLFGILIFQNVKFSSKKPVIAQILLSLAEQFVKR